MCMINSYCSNNIIGAVYNTGYSIMIQRSGNNMTCIPILIIITINIFVSSYSGVTITFVLGSLLMIIAALMFFFGASAQKLCNSLEHPNYPLFTEVND